jgi:hypothetical protein
MIKRDKWCVAFFVLIIIFLAGLVWAETTASTTSLELNETKINRAFECLENKTTGRASALTTEEVSFVLLASPKSSVLTEYKNELINRKQSPSNDLECWPRGGCKIKETALAILALDHLGEDTRKAENWLLAHNRTATEISWLLQEDSESETRCTITYDQRDYETTILIDKKINGPAGNCLSVYQNNFWFQISPSCYDKEFTMTCDRAFIANFLYKKIGSGNVYYVDSRTQASPANGEISLNLDSKCFGLSGCEYDGSLWATLALFKKQYNIQPYAPYLIALSDSNRGFFPEAFLYMITGFEDYANSMIKNQNLGNYWQTEGSVNGKYYDTSLALIALKNSNSEQVANARKRMEKYQDINSGCWMSQNTIRDTSMILWALEGREASIAVISPTTKCLESKYYCMSISDCPSQDRMGNNFWCSDISAICCRLQNQKTCAEIGGTTCPSTKVCNGITKETRDVQECCTTSCGDIAQRTECEVNGNLCKTSCSSNQKSNVQACDIGKICCEDVSDQAVDEGGNKKIGWVWLLVLGIIILILAIFYLKRDKLKLALFKSRNNVQQGGFGVGGFKPGGPPFAGRPGGFPPNGMNRSMPIRPAFTPAKPIMPQRNNPSRETPSLSDDDETFKKLKEMSE